MNETLIDRLLDLIADLEEIERDADLPEAIANQISQARWILEDVANGETSPTQEAA